MRRFDFVLFVLLPLVWLVSFGPVRASAQTNVKEPALTVEEVVKLVRSGFSEEIIITKIKKNARPFDLNGDELVDLKKEGVSNEIIKYLLDPSLPYTPAPPPAASSNSGTTKPGEPAKKYPEDSYASRVPAGPGLYFFVPGGAQPVKIELKFLLGTEEPKKLMKKGKTIGYLIGPSARTRIGNAAQTFYVRLADGKEIEELVLVNLYDKNGRRELALGPPGAKQELKAEDVQPKESLEVGPNLFRLSTQRLAPGEYLFLFIGSAEPAKGVFGKGYDFGIDPVEQKKPAGKRGR